MRPSTHGAAPRPPSRPAHISKPLISNSVSAAFGRSSKWPNSGLTNARARRSSRRQRKFRHQRAETASCAMRELPHEELHAEDTEDEQADHLHG